MEWWTKHIWTKIFAWFTLIYCVVYAGIYFPILVFFNTKEIPAGTPLYYVHIILYMICDDFDSTKTQIILYTTIVINLLWALTSVILLIVLRKNEKSDYSIKGTQKLVNVYFAWIVVGFLSFITDVVAIITFGMDVSKSSTLNDSILDGVIYLVILSSRFAVVFVFQIISWILQIIITLKLKKSLVEDDSKSNQRIVPLKPPKPALKPSKVPHLEETNVDRVRDWYKHYEGDKDKEPENNSNNNDNSFNNNGNNYYSEPGPVPQHIPRLTGNTNAGFVGNQNYYKKPRAPPPPPPKPHQIMPGADTNVMVNGVPSGTLRRQLPWSYMPSGHGTEVPQLPSKSGFPNASVFTAVAPYVPAPDYNDKPIKTQRQELGHPAWNQYL